MNCKYKYEKEIGINPKKHYVWLEDATGDERKKHWENQRKEYGFDSREIWNLDYSFVAWIYPRLKMFKEHTNAHPHELTFEQWKDIIDEMIDGFGCYLKEGVGCYDKDVTKKVDRALELFKKYFWSLWD